MGGKCFPMPELTLGRLTLPHLTLIHRYRRCISFQRWGEKRFSASGITYLVIENFNLQPKTLENSQHSAGHTYELINQTKPTNSSPLEHDDWKTILSFWNGPFMGHLNIPVSKDTLINVKITTDRSTTESTATKSPSFGRDSTFGVRPGKRGELSHVSPAHAMTT